MPDSNQHISPDELQEALRLAHYTVDNTELSGAGLVARALISTQEQLEAFRGALEEIDALDRTEHFSEVAANMGFTARAALSNPASTPDAQKGDTDA